MGYYKDERGITSFEPDDDDDTLHIIADMSIDFDYLLIVIRRHFGADAEFSQFEIRADNIHTRCIGLDYHDSMDYTDYIIISRR